MESMRLARTPVPGQMIQLRAPVCSLQVLVSRSLGLPEGDSSPSESEVSSLVVLLGVSWSGVLGVVSISMSASGGRPIVSEEVTGGVVPSSSPVAKTGVERSEEAPKTKPKNSKIRDRNLEVIFFINTSLPRNRGVPVHYSTHKLFSQYFLYFLR